MMLARVMDEAAERFGDRTAYVTADGVPVTYAELCQRSVAAAHWLRANGVRTGDVVMLALPATVDYIALYIGAARIGAITAGVNVRLTPDERTALTTAVEPTLVVDETTDLDLTMRLATHEIDTIKQASAIEDDDRPVAIVFTSGTTGLPKGAVFTNRQLDAITAIDTGGSWGAGGAQLAGNSFASLGPMTKLPGRRLICASYQGSCLPSSWMLACQPNGCTCATTSSITSKPSVPPGSVMMRTARMPAPVRRSSSASGVPGRTTATPFALFPSFSMQETASRLSSRYALGCTTITRSSPRRFCSSRYIGTSKTPGLGVPGAAALPS